MSVSKFSKKSLTALDVAVLVRELYGHIVGGYINNIYSVDNEDKYLVKIKAGNSLKLLYIEPGTRLNLTKYALPTSHKGKVQIFRRFLRGALIESIEQYNFERIVLMKLRKGNHKLSLIVELIPRGLLTLIDEEGKVLMVNKALSVKDREVKIGLTYKPPPTFPNIITQEESKLVEILLTKPNLRLGSALIKTLGIPPEIVNELLDDKIRGRKIKDLSREFIIHVIRSIKDFINEVILKPKPTLVLGSKGEYVSFHPFKPSRLWGENFKLISYESFNEVVDEYFSKLESEILMSSKLKSLEDEKSRLKKVLENVIKEREKTSNEVKVIERIISVLELNFEEIEKIHDCVISVVKARGWCKDLITSCGIKSFNKDEGTYTIMLDGETLTFSVRSNVKTQYFELKKKLANLMKKLRKISEKEEELRAKLKELDKRLMIEGVRPLLKASEWFMSYYWIITSNSYLAIGGRNAEQNEKLVRKFLGDDDIFMHADIHGAPVFIIMCKGERPSEVDIGEVAVLAAAYSKAWRLGLASIDVFWVWGKQVSKAAPPGQYLPKGSFMIYGKKNYIRNVKLELCIGIEIVDSKSYRVIAGPKHLVERRAIAYMTIVPGEEGVESIAKKFIDKVKKVKPQLITLTVNDIASLIPGRSKIIEFKFKED